MKKWYRLSNSSSCTNGKFLVNGLQILLISLLMTVGGVGCSSQSAKTDVGVKYTFPAEKYVIGPSDVLSISVWNHKYLNRTVTVRPDGMMSFAMIGEIPAAGYEPLQLRARLEEALKRYIKIVPGEVSIVVDAVNSYKIAVMGEVKLPGRFEFKSQISVLDALAKAGGMTEFAKRNKILVMRSSQGRSEKIIFNYDKLIASVKSHPPLMLMPGDVVLVP